jgi:cysteine dioxygenase
MHATTATPTTASTDACTAFPKLQPLVEYLRGLTGRADLAVLSRLLSGVDLARADVERACIFGTRGYRRNVIAASEWFELLALTWRSGHCTPIHDHMGVSCAFRVIQGTGTEIRYAKTDSGLVRPTESVSMPPGYVCSANDPDIHQVANLQAPGQDLITLHIYSPRIVKMNTYSSPAACAVEAGDVYGGSAGCAQ